MVIRLEGKVPDSLEEAWEMLSANFIDNRGEIEPKVPDYIATDQENIAINYLCLDWDYACQQ